MKGRNVDVDRSTMLEQILIGYKMPVNFSYGSTPVAGSCEHNTEPQKFQVP
jgi:hypothetical protein